MRNESGIPLVVTHGVLVLNPRLDLGDELMVTLHQEVCSAVETSRFRAVVLDLSGLPIVDTWQAEAFSELCQAVEILGPKSFIAGIRPSVAATLIHLGITFDETTVVRRVDDVLSMLETEGR